MLIVELSFVVGVKERSHAIEQTPRSKTDIWHVRAMVTV